MPGDGEISDPQWFFLESQPRFQPVMVAKDLVVIPVQVPDMSRGRHAGMKKRVELKGWAGDSKEPDSQWRQEVSCGSRFLTSPGREGQPSAPAPSPCRSKFSTCSITNSDRVRPCFWVACLHLSACGRGG